MRQFSLTPNRAEWGDPGAKSGLVVKWRVISCVDPSGTPLRSTRPYGVSGDLASVSTGASLAVNPALSVSAPTLSERTD